MKFNKWTVGLAALGVVSFASAARADEQMSQVQTALTQTTLSGYVDTAMQWNPGTDSGPETSDGIGFQFPRVPHYSFAKNDGFSLNAVDIALDRPEDSSAWAAGYHVELMWGPSAVGVPLQDNDEDTISEFAVRQAFIRLHTPIGGNGIDWQIGVFDSIIGYESNSDPLNPNYTRSYGYTIEPTTFTGILGTYKVNDDISLSAGIANNDGGLGGITPGFVSSTSYESQKTYMASVSLTAPDSMGFLKGATLSGGMVHGSDSFQFGAGSTTSLYVGATIPTPMTQLKVGASFDYLFEPIHNGSGSGAVPTNEGADIWNIAGYATFQATDKLSFNARAEILSDDAPATTFEDVEIYPSHRAEEMTLTVQYNLWANVITRGEFRWDHVEGGDSADDFGVSPKTGDSFRKNDFLLALNVIYQF